MHEEILNEDKHADLTLENRLLKKTCTLAKIGIPPTMFYRCYDRFVERGPEGLEDRPSCPSRVWNRIPEAVRDQIVTLALEEPELSPRELAVRFTDTEKYPRHGHSDQWRSRGSMSEASVDRLLKAHDLITSPAYIGRGRVQRQDHSSEPDVADGFYLPEGHRLGLVLSLDHLLAGNGLPANHERPR